MSRILAPESSPIRHSSDNLKSMNDGHGSYNNGKVNDRPSSTLGFTRTNFETRSRSPEDLKKNAYSGSNGEKKLGSSSKNATERLKVNGQMSGLKRYSAENSENEDLSGSEATTGSINKRFKSALKKFEYDGPGSTKAGKKQYDADELSSLSSLSGDEVGLERMLKDKPKKRKFVLGRAKVDSDREKSSDVEVQPKETDVSSKKHIESTVSAEESAKIEATVKRIKSVRPAFSFDEIKEIYVEAGQEMRLTLDLLDKRKPTHVRPKKVIPESPSEAATPYKPSPHSKAISIPSSPMSPSQTRSMISPNQQRRPPINNPIKVTTKSAPVQRTSSSPIPQIQRVIHNGKPASAAQSAQKGIQKSVKQNSISARSTPSVDIVDSDDFSEDDDGSEIEEVRRGKGELNALNWFNTSTSEQLIDIVGVTMEQAQTIISLRPFDDTDDVDSKLRSAKGVQPRLFYDCIDLMAALKRIDGVLADCTGMADKLSTAFAKWDTSNGGKNNTDVEYLHKQPEGAKEGVVLRDFQLYGVNWLNLLHRMRCSGILADDMGLGKTAQVISFLNHITFSRKVRPHLVVVPSSVITNWMREFETFGTNLSVFKYHGSQSERIQQQHELRDARDDYDVIITTYEMASGGERDHKFLRKYDFETAIFDEGHVLKNQKSIKHEKIMRIRSKWRLLLTGTPLQNNLAELISLLKFIMPHFFDGADEALQHIFKVNRQTLLSKKRVSHAKQMMRPFTLRRTKLEVLDNLKKKTEKVKYCDMTKAQAALYDDSFAKTRAAIMAVEEGETNATTAAKRKGQKGAGSKPDQQAAHLMQLRKAANHPLHFRRLYTDSKIDALARDYIRVAEHADQDLKEIKEDFAINSDAELCMSIAMQYKECSRHVLPQEEWINSGKINALKEVIEEAKAQGERLIIFSQFVQTLEIVCRALEVFDISYRGFTGSTKVNDRQELVDEFTRDSSITCFLLSTKAGGVGINLTAANWVVLFDQDFNPQNDQQAADRCYRIGQEKEVSIVRLISRGTIDEQIYELGKTKLKLAQRVQGNDEEGADGEEVEKKVEQTLMAGIMASHKERNAAQ